jgi:hypothetical protein
MKIRSCIAAFLFFGVSLSVQAADTVTAKVLNTGTYGNGELYIITDTQINEPNCPNSRVEVPASHPQLKIWLATALMAEASGRSTSFTPAVALEPGPPCRKTEIRGFLCHQINLF